ncbi:MAG: hypothetical protein ACR2MX_16170 [Cyclobacteriaceae bacterium]
MSEVYSQLSSSKKNLFFLIFALIALLLLQCTDPMEEELFSAVEKSEAPQMIDHRKTGVLPSGALFEIAVPPQNWNGELVVWAHGYVNFNEPLALPDDAVDGVPISIIVNQLGYAYASTSYRDNGLIVQDAILDLEELVDQFKADFEEPNHTYLVGGSEGGIITALAIEQDKGIFDGGFSLCGPVGNFRKQVNYFGDFNVVFNYFFPGIMPITPAGLDDEVQLNDLIARWGTDDNPGPLQAQVIAALVANPNATRQLLNVTRASIDNDDQNTIGATVLGLLRYSVYATNDAISKLNGMPYDNKRKWYRGSDNDYLLNRKIQRFRADRRALIEMRRNYETSGKLNDPLVTMHTTGDPIQPYWHEIIYRFKTIRNGSFFQHVNIPIFNRYGHCNFTQNEVLTGFAVMILKVTLEDLLVPASMFPDTKSQEEFINQSREHGATPIVVQDAVLQAS